jgi:phage terminase large subunit-like protein
MTAFSNIAEAIEHDWRSKARPEQLPPPGDWSVWIYLGGRGTGKTRSGGEAVRKGVETGKYRRVALIAPTAADARDVMVEGESGLLAICPDSNRPTFEPSKRRLTWPNGAIATLYSAEEPDRLRGPQHDFLWADELAAWKGAQSTWDMAMMGLRLGKRPRAVVTTTPRPIPLLRALKKRSGKDVVVTTGTTHSNRENLPESFFSQIIRQYEGTRLGRQELNAEILDDFPGALWTREILDRANAPVTVPDLARIVVAVDASGARGADDEAADAIGIVVAGKGVDGRAYVLADRSYKLSPAGWGRRAVAAFHEFKADRLIYERNFGGAMVEHVIKTADPNVGCKEVVASRGKIVRAEPVSALYEQNRVTHVGTLAELEDQMCLMASDGYQGEGSPDRVDALVWALSELMLGSVQKPVPIIAPIYMGTPCDIPGGATPRMSFDIPRGF